MKEEQQHNPAHAARMVAVTGKIPAISSRNSKRLTVFLVEKNTILSQSPVGEGGTFQFHIAKHLASAPGVFAVLGPKGLDSESLASRAELPRVALASGNRHESGAIEVSFSAEKISDELIEPWWLWCREYTVSGTIETAGGCPAGSYVTVYNVTCGTSGLVKTPIETVSTDSNGNFTFSFNWCSGFCWWPCWPIWWHCWPWWWELDILAVLENIERRIVAQSAANAIVAPASAAPLRQPSGADLMTGVGFAATRAASALKPDSARTELIASKFANPRIRELFPYWWWCCENPNIVFSATQGATVILDEDPNTSTRWCFASGQTVSLTANNEAVGACPTPPVSDNCAFAWSSVGDMPGGILAGNITSGYANGSGACSNLAFAGTLNLNGVLAGDCAAYYQVLAGQWGGNGNPARGGTAPATSAPLSLPGQLVNWVSIWRESTHSVEVDPVVMGPFNYNGYSNLYVTPAQRQAGVPVSIAGQIGAFPTVVSPDFVIGWDAPDLVLTVAAENLIAPAKANGVTLTLNPFDSTGTPIIPFTLPDNFDMGPDLVLMVDTTPLTQATIDWNPPAQSGVFSGVYNADGTPATLSTGSTTSCPAYQINGSGYVLIHTTVTDDQGHLAKYFIETQYGNDQTAAAQPGDRDYSQAPTSFTAPTIIPPLAVDAGYGTPITAPPTILPTPPIQAWSFVGGGDTAYIPIGQTCCYDFQLWVSKRTTDGQTFACSEGLAGFQTVNITVAP
jgi:hypothetical protein